MELVIHPQPRLMPAPIEESEFDLQMTRVWPQFKCHPSVQNSTEKRYNGKNKIVGFTAFFSVITVTFQYLPVTAKMSASVSTHTPCSLVYFLFCTRIIQFNPDHSSMEDV